MQKRLTKSALAQRVFHSWRKRFLQVKNQSCPGFLLIQCWHANIDAYGLGIPTLDGVAKPVQAICQAGGVTFFYPSFTFKAISINISPFSVIQGMVMMGMPVG